MALWSTIRCSVAASINTYRTFAAVTKMSKACHIPTVSICTTIFGECWSMKKYGSTTLYRLRLPPTNFSPISRRFLDEERTLKCIVPCTPLAIIKCLEYVNVYDKSLEIGSQLKGKTISIINRSEVVGRPLAALLGKSFLAILFPRNSTLESQL